jgi:adenylate cyclase
VLQALRARSRNSRRLIGTAKIGAMAVSGDLSEFYERISGRTDHFRDETGVDAKTAGD